MLLGRHQLTRHDSARRLVRDSVTSSSETMDSSIPFRYTRRLLPDKAASLAHQTGRQQALSDDHSEVEPRLPIPNRNVKRFCADDSGLAPVKVGHRQTPIHEKPVHRTGFFWTVCPVQPFSRRKDSFLYTDPLHGDAVGGATSRLPPYRNRSCDGLVLCATAADLTLGT